MELPVSLQGSQMLLAMILGLGLALVYDLLRALRRIFSLHKTPLDLLFCLLTLAALFFYALYPGRGELRLYMLLGVLLGGSLYFLLLSPWILPVFLEAASILRHFFQILTHPILQIAKKFCKIVFSLFSSWKKWFTMKVLSKYAAIWQQRSGRHSLEAPKIVTSHQNHHFGADRVCYHYPDLAQLPDHRGQGRIRGPAGADHLRDRAEYAAAGPDRKHQHHRRRRRSRSYQAGTHGRR
ncbi:MAG: hypothetical protein IKS29_02810 [Oscillospiraceae bacterium]|nr:hypothetical protein [Oscillospiraceae bacterium]